MDSLPALESMADAILAAMDRSDIARLAELLLAETDRRGLISDWGLSPEWDWEACPDKVRDFGRVILAAAQVLPPGGSIETGVFRGGTSGPLILCAPPDAFHVTIDPFGLPGQSYEDFEEYSYWPEARSTLLKLTALAHERNVTFCHYMMGAQSFIDADLLQHPGQFRIVHLDGDHSIRAVARELQYFRSKIRGPALFILDDHDDHFPGVQAGLDIAGAGLARVFHKLYPVYSGKAACGFSAWLHASS